MKFLALVLSLAPSLALAHGTLTHQAAEAIDSAGNVFNQSHTRDEQRMVNAITAVKTGREQFTVTIQLSNQARFAYACHENEEVEPVLWECAAN